MKATLYFDGACLGNPGPMGIGYVLEGPDGVLAEGSERLPGNGTNNIAEYTALIRGLEKAIDLGVAEIVIRGDSQLVINQLLGKFRVTHPGLRPLHAKLETLAAKFQTIDIKWIPREQNKQADKLSYRALDGPEAGAPAGAPASPPRATLGSKPSVREHSILCPTCRKPCTLRIQKAKDGTERIRQECPDHGFVAWAPITETFLKLARATGQGPSAPPGR